ncbi:acetyl-CoA hydrolase/transferase C-terminal domain-containing protein [Sphingobium sp.]|uniref:acetyl-CoA hydrolase/transferase C-terminal domain-containing protein n=1 Tax=Sphingobium sp. TaxID=1912891 RepID=UPI002C51F639|nr:acetyl-CoA hydrolase/transferase C-terminal domain-containing protein [Sphingobium sp.]HUD92688.1 acetyl-CoA hydrolase/transferase C-terminal domain-containing protein [Sphingobium sp.]
MASDLDALWREFQPGRTIYVPGATGESLALAEALKADPGRAAGICFLSCLVPGMNEAVDYAGLAPDSNLTTFMLPGCARDSFTQGRVTLIPRTYWGAAQHLQAARCDVAIAHVAPPDAAGLCSLGIASDFAPLVWPQAAVRILVVNPSMPRLPRALTLRAADAHLMVTLDGPLVYAAPAATNAEAEAIAERVAALVPDGAHLQTGIGGAPGAVWKHLRAHKGIVLRSGMANDWLRDLADAGALAEDVPHLAGIAYGSHGFYDDLARSDLVGFATTIETHGLPALSNVPRLTSVNSALEVDLFGQVNVEWQGARLSSGVGGGPDFMRAAIFSPGGRSIIALPATARGGMFSRIVARLDRPSVGIARSDIDTVITEQGVAELRDKGIDQRAEALICIAAPEFRDALTDEWRRLRAGFR